MYNELYIPNMKRLTRGEQEYLRAILSGVDNQLMTTAEWLGTDEAKIFFRTRQAEINEFFENSGIMEELSTIINSNVSDSESLMRRFYQVGTALGYHDLHQRLVYSPADREALYTLTQYNFDLIRDVNVNIREGIRETLFGAVASGQGAEETTRQLLSLDLKPLPIRDKQTGEIVRMMSTRTRARMIARTEHARAVNTGTLQAYANYGVEKAEIITVGDSDVCDDCLDLEDKNPYTLEEAMNLLPAHPNCYSVDTQVFTDNGWKYFYDVTEDDKILSLNPEDGSTEFLDYVRTVSHNSHLGYLVHIHNNDIDFCVTLDHDVFVYEDTESKFIKAYKLLDSRYDCDFLINHEDDYYVSLHDCDVELTPYQDMVYCLELPKYHTLWTRRNGKTSWNGNCRCSYGPVVEAPMLFPEDNPVVIDLTRM